MEDTSYGPRVALEKITPPPALRRRVHAGARIRHPVRVNDVALPIPPPPPTRTAMSPPALAPNPRTPRPRQLRWAAAWIALLACGHPERSREEPKQPKADKYRQATDLSAPQSTRSARDQRSSPELERACSGGDAPACVVLGNRRRTQGAARVLPLFQQACDQGFSDGCAELGLLYELGREVQRDSDQARTLFKRACDSRSALGCSRLAALLLRDPQHSLADAVGYSEAGCSAGAGLGCANLGIMHKNGDGVPRDLKRANELFRSACKLEFGPGCRLLGEAYAEGAGLRPDPRGAASFSIRACLLGDAIGCGNAGVNYQRGLGVQANPSKAAHYFQRACTLGESRYCELLERFRQLAPTPSRPQ